MVERKTYRIEVLAHGGHWRDVAGPYRASSEYAALRYYRTVTYPMAGGKLAEDRLTLPTGGTFRAVEVTRTN